MALRRSLHLLIACGLLGLATPAEGLEERFEDLSVSVEVAPTFGLSLSNPFLVFPHASPGQAEVLGQGQFFNEVRCRSNSGHAWHLQAQVVSLKNLERNYVLPASQLQWKVVETTGVSPAARGQFDFEPFSEQPMLMYAGHGDEAKGHELVLRLQYRLVTPPDAPAGNYTGQIIFTMTETP